MKIVINGGGIAGFALARFLSDRGMTPIVIERAPGFSALGHVIALKAEGVHVLDRLGIRAACEARAQPNTTRVTFSTAGGISLRTMPVGQFDTAIGGYLPLRRSDLHAALHDRIRDRVEIRYGREVRSFREDETGVDVTLSDGTTERADALIGADGVHSVVRRMLFGGAGEHRLGGSYIAIDVAAPGGGSTKELRTFLGRGQLVAMFPASEGRMLGLAYHAEEHLRAKLRTPLDARRFFERKYADFAAPVREMFAAIDNQSFVFVDDITMITLPALSRGRVALLGDAGACPTFMSGMGSAYAMTSAEKLAIHLSGAADVPAALMSYGKEALVHALALQKNARTMARIMMSRSRVMVAVRNGLLALVPETQALQRLNRFFHKGWQAAAAPAQEPPTGPAASSNARSYAVERPPLGRVVVEDHGAGEPSAPESAV